MAGIVRDGRVLVDVYVSGAVRDRATTLRGEGMHVEAVSARAPQRMVEGWLPLGALDDVAALDGTRAVVPVYPGILNTGGTLSEGDAAHRGPQARALGPTGAGIPVGIISGSINQRGAGVAGSQSTGDLPADVQILEDGASTTDEGRAMAEIVYDTHPDSQRSSSPQELAGRRAASDNIDALVAAGAKIIADDVTYLTEPFFQDGIIAQAADRAKANGTAYLRCRREPRATELGGNVHASVGLLPKRFRPRRGEDTRQTSRPFPSGQQLSVFVQWDDPFGAATNDFALDIYNANTSAFIGTIDSNNVASGVPARERGPNRQRSGTSFAMDDSPRRGERRHAAPEVDRQRGLHGSLPAEYPGTTGAIDPDAASARGALAVAAVRHNDAGLDTVESFSSRGPTVTRYLDRTVSGSPRRTYA